MNYRPSNNNNIVFMTVMTKFVFVSDQICRNAARDLIK